MKILNNIYSIVLLMVVLAIFGVPLFLIVNREYEEWKIIHDCLNEGHSEQICEKHLEELLPS